jgi:hypothetical protein
VRERFKGDLYSVLKSGEKSFFEMMLPLLRKYPGKKCMWATTFPPSISTLVIQSCKTNQIEFVCLLLNSTDRLQPLDVGVFGHSRHGGGS